MPSTYSSSLRLELQSTGENANTWGVKTNNNLNLLQQAIAGYVKITLVSASATYTLDIADASASDGRNAFIKLAGTVASAISVVVPDVAKGYWVKNSATGSPLTFRTSSGTGFTLPTNEWVFAIADGASVVNSTPTSLAGYAKLASTQIFTGANTFTSATTFTGPVSVSASSVFTQPVDIKSNLSVVGNFQVSGATTLSSVVDIKGATSLASTLVANGNATFNGNVSVSGSFLVSGVATLASAVDIKGPTSLASTLVVGGAATLNGNVSVSGTLVGGAVTLTGNVSVGGTFTVSGASTFTSAVNIQSNLSVTGNALVSGTTTLASSVDIKGPASLASTLLVGGAATLNGNVSVAGAFTVSGASIFTSAVTLKAAVSSTQGAIFTSVQDSKGDLRTIIQNSQSGAYALVLGDAGKHISITTGGVTVPAGVFSAGDAISIYNNSGSSQTITQDGGTTLRLAGTATTGNRTLAQYGICTVLCVAANTFVISGAGLT